MGCGESKIKTIHIPPEDGGHNAKEADVPTISGHSHEFEDDMLPNRLLAAIPVSDLGDSLDSRCGLHLYD
jgi:hypothetical protein